ncbi:MAG TPA: hypothetical protein VF932_18210 [Anaerolineae bacterium]
MIRDRKAWEKWEAAYIAQKEPNFHKNLQIVEELYSHARSLGKWRLNHGLDGIEVKLKIARVVNVSTITGTDRAEP